MSAELTVTFRFRLQQDVQIVPLKLVGRIFARCDRGAGLVDYRVIYWSEGKRCDEWLYEHELSETECRKDEARLLKQLQWEAEGGP